MPPPEELRVPRRVRSGRRVAAGITAGVVVVPSVFWIGVEESFITPKLVVVAVLAVVCVAGAATAHFGIPVRRPNPTAVDWRVAAFAVLVAVSFLASVDRSQSFWGEKYQRQGVLAAALYVVFYSLARFAVTDGRRLTVMARGVAVGGVPVAVYALAQRAGLDLLWDEIPGGRVFSTIGQTNSLGAYLALVVPVAIGAALTAGPRPSVYGAAALLEGVALVLTESRGGYLGVVVGLVAFAFIVIRGRRRGLARFVVVITVSALAMGLAATTTPGLSDSSARAWSRALSADEWTTGSIRNHLDLWEVAAHVVVDHPLVGTGPDTFPIVFGDYRDEVLPPESASRLRIYRVESPHNIVLAHAAGSGVPAALMFVVIVLGPALAVMVGSGRQADQVTSGAARAGVAAGVVGGFVASLFITADFSTTWMLWIFSGALVAVAATERTKAGR